MLPKFYRFTLLNSPNLSVKVLILHFYRKKKRHPFRGAFGRRVLLDLAALQIVALFAAVTHGEGLAGQDAVGNDAAEQLALFHTGNQEADGVFLGGQSDQSVVIMDVVDLALVLLQILIQEGLQHTNSQLALGAVQIDGAGLRADVPLDGVAAFGADVFLNGLQHLLGIGVEPYLISGSVKGIISQRLVRRICLKCKTSYTPDDNELSLVKMKPKTATTFYKGKGCPECFYSGYSGRIAVFEILLFSKDVKRAILQQDPVALDKAIEETGFVSIIENCQNLVLEGITTAREVSRAVSRTDY